MGVTYQVCVPPSVYKYLANLKPANHLNFLFYFLCLIFHGFSGVSIINLHQLLSINLTVKRFGNLHKRILQFFLIP